MKEYCKVCHRRKPRVMGICTFCVLSAYKELKEKKKEVKKKLLEEVYYNDKVCHCPNSPKTFIHNNEEICVSCGRPKDESKKENETNE